MSLVIAMFEGSGGLAFMTAVLLVGTVELFLGAVLGWWLRGGGAKSNRIAADDPVSKARFALSNLNDLTYQVRSDVGAHSTYLDAIGYELNSCQDEDGPAVDDFEQAVTRILKANDLLQQQLQSAEKKLDEQAEQLKAYATSALTDSLTGLGNRRAFDTELARRMSECNRHKTPFCLLMLDIDHFKRFNDAHGHLAGDHVLRMVGRTLKASVRAPDFVTRYGGEEFGILMPNTTLDLVPPLAERIRSSIEQAECDFQGQKLRITASIGAAEAVPGQDIAGLMKSADEALYLAKQTGRNRAHFEPHAAARSIAAAVAPAVKAKRDIAKNGRKRPAINESPVADSRTDAQTGLPNRTAFCEDIRRRLAEAQRHGNRLSIMLVKIANLQQLMECHGEPAGDLMLRACTDFFVAARREMDLVARFDSDVFAIGLPGTFLLDAVKVGSRLKTQIENCPLQIADMKTRFTIAVGVAEAQPAEDLVSFLGRTEQAQQASSKSADARVHHHNGTTIEPAPQSNKVQRSILVN